MGPVEAPPALSIVGRKNSGKTTLTVALAASLKALGHRVASIKHGHHDFEIDQPGRDSWRHYHEGGVEAVLVAAAGKLALIERSDDAEPDPRELVWRFFTGRRIDLVLVEGFKHGPFPRIEVFRPSLHPRPLLEEADPASRPEWLALVSDERMKADVPFVFWQPDGSHVAELVRMVAERFNLEGR